VCGLICAEDRILRFHSRLLEDHDHHLGVRRCNWCCKHIKNFNFICLFYKNLDFTSKYRKIINNIEAQEIEAGSNRDDEAMGSEGDSYEDEDYWLSESSSS
jgi:hypothetical protein